MTRFRLPAAATYLRPALRPQPNVIGCKDLTYSLTNSIKTLTQVQSVPSHKSFTTPTATFHSSQPLRIHLPAQQRYSSSMASFISRLARPFTGLATAVAPRPVMSYPDPARATVQRIIDENFVVVFSKSFCPHCRAAKQHLNHYKASFLSVELDQRDDGKAIQDALAELTGQRTVPNIFINKQHIGGNSDLQGKRELRELLLQAGAV